MNARTPKGTHHASVVKCLCGEAGNVSVYSPVQASLSTVLLWGGRSPIFRILAKRVPGPGHATDTMNDKRTDADNAFENAPRYLIPNVTCRPVLQW